jgi:hypothetical protein
LLLAVCVYSSLNRTTVSDHTSGVRGAIQHGAQSKAEAIRVYDIAYKENRLRVIKTVTK